MTLALEDFAERFEAAAAAKKGDRLGALAHAYRAYAQAMPHEYRLVNDRPLPRDLLPAGLEARAAAPLLRAVGTLERARSAWAFAQRHGLPRAERALPARRRPRGGLGGRDPGAAAHASADLDSPLMFEDLLRTWDGEEVCLRYDEPSGAWMFVCVHSTALGPGMGGTRMKVYPRPTMRSATGSGSRQAMTLKQAAANLPFGGGKAVLAVPAIPVPGAARHVARSCCGTRTSSRRWAAAVRSPPPT